MRSLRTITSMTSIEGDDDSYDLIDKRWGLKYWVNDAGQIRRKGGLPPMISYYRTDTRGLSVNKLTDSTAADRM